MKASVPSSSSLTKAIGRMGWFVAVIVLLSPGGPFLGGRSLVQGAVQTVKVPDSVAKKLEEKKRLTRKEKKLVQNAEKQQYIELRNAGQDEVSNTEEAAILRNYRLRNKKRKGLLRKRPASLAEVLFPGVAPNEYQDGENIFIYADIVESRKTPIPYDYYDLPIHCPQPPESKRLKRKNLGMRLTGHDPLPMPFRFLSVKGDHGCVPLCSQQLNSKQIRLLRRLIERQYRVQVQMDQLPVLMRSKDFNYAVRGYPIGFQAPKSFQALKTGEFYLFNHLKFVISYNTVGPNRNRIVGFDVLPMSIRHAASTTGVVDEMTKLDTCKGDPVENDPSRYLPLKMEGAGPLTVTFSYEVQWEETSLPWSDRWDVYLVGAPDDDLHYFSIVNSLMIVLFLTGAISTIMIRTLRKDIAVYNEMDALGDETEETGWKLVHGDVFRPPQFSPMVLSVVVGTGCQIGLAFGLAMVAAVLKMVNPIQKGQTLTAIILLYVMCGSAAGYVSSRIYKFMDQKAWKINTIATATALPGCLVVVFSILNVFLSFVRASTAVSFLTIIVLFLLWVCVSAPLVFLGAVVGLRAEKIEVPTKTNQIARIVPSTTPWHVRVPYTWIMGGILPFGSVCIELAFIMSALWLHQIYYVMGFLLAVLLILAATCAQVSVVLTYLQLCAEDHRWWWNSFWNCASSGVYLFLYSLWFLSSRLELVGVLPVIVYLTYMAMISVCFGLFCGSVGFLSSFWFTRKIYGAVKVD